jgi:uncharacterized protein (TIGR03067 family)
MRTFALPMALLALAGFARADDTDPEPPGSSDPEVRKLAGTWKADRFIWQGKTPKGTPQTTYTFKGDKLSVDTGKSKYTAKLKFDTKNRPFSFELTSADAKIMTRRMAFKIEKGELFLAAGFGKDAKVDFSGESGAVLVFKKEEKK